MLFDFRTLLCPNHIQLGAQQTPNHGPLLVRLPPPVGRALFSTHWAPVPGLCSCPKEELNEQQDCDRIQVPPRSPVPCTANRAKTQSSCAGASPGPLLIARRVAVPRIAIYQIAKAEITTNAAITFNYPRGLLQVQAQLQPQSSPFFIHHSRRCHPLGSPSDCFCFFLPYPRVLALRSALPSLGAPSS